MSYKDTMRKYIYICFIWFSFGYCTPAVHLWPTGDCSPQFGSSALEYVLVDACFALFHMNVLSFGTAILFLIQTCERKQKINK